MENFRGDKRGGGIKGRGKHLHDVACNDKYDKCLGWYIYTYIIYQYLYLSIYTSTYICIFDICIHLSNLSMTNIHLYKGLNFCDKVKLFFFIY